MFGRTHELNREGICFENFGFDNIIVQVDYQFGILNEAHADEAVDANFIANRKFNGSLVVVVGGVWHKKLNNCL